jgi:hypothetical protein
MNMVNMFMGNSANPFSEIMKKMMVSEEEKEEDEDEDEEDKEE